MADTMNCMDESLKIVFALTKIGTAFDKIWHLFFSGRGVTLQQWNGCQRPIKAGVERFFNTMTFQAEIGAGYIRRGTIMAGR
jgi:hypothetical protein